MSTPSPSLVDVEAHKARVGSLLGTTPVERRPLQDCLDLVLAEELLSPVALPPFDNSAMDGYAVHSHELLGASRESPVELLVAEDIPAGRTDALSLLGGTAHRIMTGAPVPAGADAVVQVELTDGGTQRVRVFSEVKVGANIRRAGEDVLAGTRVLPAGTVLGASELGLASAVGVTTLPVFRPPRVLVLSTGSELVEPGRPLEFGQIYESNGTMLAAAVRQAGAVPELLRFVPDDVDAFHAAIAPHLSTVDLVLTSGGVSAGAYEVVKDALAGHGVEFTKVAMQPGMPQGAGWYRGVPVVSLPGNPVSSLVSFEVFLRPALLAARGVAAADRRRVQATLAEGLRAPAGRRQFRRGFYDHCSGSVKLVGGPGSHLMSALTQANCLLDVPEEVTELTEGEQVTVMLTR
ncbi:molybdopterin molybdotransferase [Crossiella equi]|uniref:Molybdopterin molybdenumtransferase n=1 Tax=Crossiella equi TaxID=130796 RepID=A0ABS5AEQ3_9PSEU|nr:gephyrin-like molybdotransferase Glp [Crossiella equi]MBP2475068.1 molybdopterin molybdotransferase [Crossiella equi]